MKPMVDFNGRVVLITGASGALGEAVVEAFLSRGASVVGVARSMEKNGRERFHTVPADLTQTDGAEAAAKEAFGLAGRIDVLVHVMGAFAGGAPVAETGEDTWDGMMNLNLRAAFLVARAVLPHMIKARYGRIVAVGSRVGVEPVAGLSAYGVSKAGLNSLIQTIAKEVRDQGITANVVMPSTIDTAANRKAMPKADFSSWVQPASIAEQIVSLASESAGDVSGALIPVYGRA
jgi:NAD(P)-dependent dehydrogenase (short-subunit alcohol dehydrogenase family)